VCFEFLFNFSLIYRVIHKSLRDFRPLRYSSRDDHVEGVHVNRGRDTPSLCPTLQVLDMCTLRDAADVNPVIKFLRHAAQHVSEKHLPIIRSVRLKITACAMVCCCSDGSAVRRAAAWSYRTTLHLISINR
jgi:hypothetical protein